VPAERCSAVLAGGGRCEEGKDTGAYCSRHAGALKSRPYKTRRDLLNLVFRGATTRLKRGRHRDGAEDSDPELMWMIFSAAVLMYDFYWRVDVHGVENVPTEGRALLAANHSGALPIDGVLLKIATLKEHGRNPWLLAGDLVYRLGAVGRFVERMGNAPADRSKTEALLERDELLGVFPEGYKGIGKGWSQRYRVQPFGRGGFVKLALETGAPIVPVAIGGAEEIYPMLGNVGPVARLLRLPYFPVTPTFPLMGPLGLLPLPAKCTVIFGAPIDTTGQARSGADPEVVNELTDEVRSRVQRMLDEWRRGRRSVLV
jgi:1-acyl-sn-glycerol-3-phosphate acyltransferase